MQGNNSELIDITQFVLKELKKRGIKTADVFARRTQEDRVTVREREVETVRRKVTRGLGVRVIQDGRLGFAHTCDVAETSLTSVVEQAVALAKEASEDPGHGLWETVIPPGDDLDLVDDGLAKISVEDKINRALELESAMLSADPRIRRSGGADWSDSDEEVVIANTLGLSHGFRGTGVAIVGQAVAEEDGQMQRGWWWSQARHQDDLDSVQEVGAEAGRRAVQMLGAQQVATVKAPVIFEAPVASQVLGVLFSAMNGEMVRKRASYLLDQLGKRIASKLVTVIDDGQMPRKLGSQAVDDEGIPVTKKVLVDKGKLTQYLYDVRGARLSGAEPTGNAHRSYGSLPGVGPMNLYIAPGDVSRETLIGSVENGLFLTRIMGSGVNLVTGDVSWGASGLWIENGELAYPVEGITIAGNLKDLWRDIDQVADDLEWRSTVASPTFKVCEMMIGGK